MTTRNKLSSILFFLATLLSGAAHAQENGTIRLGIYPEFAPMEFVENGVMVGFEVDLANALAKSMKKKIEWTEINFKGLIPGIIANRFDASISAMFITPERAKVVAFADSYYSGGIVIVVKAGSPFKTINDLLDKKVAVQLGTKSIPYMKENHPRIQQLEVETIQDQLNMLSAGRVDAAVSGKPAALYLAKIRPEFRVLEGQLTTEAYGIAVNIDKPELTAEFNKALKQIKADGTYTRIERKWFQATK
jgi:polar amino acid transport system substrate-binding protein